MANERNGGGTAPESPPERVLDRIAGGYLRPRHRLAVHVSERGRTRPRLWRRRRVVHGWTVTVAEGDGGGARFEFTNVSW